MMKMKWYRHFVKNPTRVFVFFYTLLIWRFLAVYEKIDTLNLFMVFLITLVCFFLYMAIRDLAGRRKIGRALLIIPAALFLLNLMDTHIVYALYRAEGIQWHIDLRLLAALYPVMVLVWLFVQERFHPLGMAMTAPFVILSWITLTQERMKAWIVIFLFLSMVECSVWAYARTRKACRRRGLRVNLHRRMMIAAALVFLCAAPAVFFPLSCIGTKSIGERLAEGKGTRYVVEFNLNSLGYGSETSLGGTVTPQDDILLKVDADAPLYLRGNVSDIYTGHSWERTWHEINGIPDTAIHEIRTDSRKYQDGENGSLRIFPEVSSSSALFSPLNATYLYADGRVGFDRYYIFYNMGRRRGTDPYTVTYKHISYDTDFDYSLENVKDRYAIYLQLPEEYSPETQDLVSGIVRGADTCSEKVAAIHAFLINNYTYSLFVEDPPADRDFVAHFLFEEKRGYCTYFATSAAVMFRLAGIPSRYVQGFRIDGERQDPDGRYILTGKEAHAWTEVLVSPGDNLWTIVDCTPGQERGTGSTDIIPEYTPPVTDQPYVPMDLPYPDEATGRGFIREHLFLFGLIVLFCLAGLYFAWKAVSGAVRRRNSIFVSKSIVSFYMKVRKKLAPAGIFDKDTRSDMEEAAAIQDRTLKGYLVPIVTQYYDEYYGEMHRDCGVNRREAYRYVKKYARVNKKKPFT